MPERRPTYTTAIVGDNELRLIPTRRRRSCPSVPREHANADLPVLALLSELFVFLSCSTSFRMAHDLYFVTNQSGAIGLKAGDDGGGIAREHLGI